VHARAKEHYWPDRYFARPCGAETKDILSMKQRAVFLVLVLSLLTYTTAGLSGCGSKHNSLSVIIVTPLDPAVAMGKTLQLSVTAIFSDGLIVTSWSQVTWQSSDAKVATVSSTGAVTGVAEGIAMITATDIFHPEITRSVTVSVTQLLSITISPNPSPPPTISLGTTTSQQLTATGFYSLATPTTWSTTWPPDITTLVFWISSNTSVASISNVLGSHGLATAGSTTGTTTITATDLATGITGTTTLTVVP
jgi:trimeric autotransporter adhesin